MQATVSILFKNFDLCIQFTFFLISQRSSNATAWAKKNYAFLAIYEKSKQLQINAFYT